MERPGAGLFQAVGEQAEPGGQAPVHSLGLVPGTEAGCGKGRGCAHVEGDSGWGRVIPMGSADGVQRPQYISILEAEGWRKRFAGSWCSRASL